MVGPSKGAAAPGQAVSPQCPALSRKRSQEVQGAGSRAASAWLSLLPLFQMMRPTDDILKELCKPAVLQRLLKIESLPLLWLVLRGLDLLSERPEMVREIRALLPDIMETQQFANTPVTLKVLNIFRNVMRHLGKRHASPIALELAEKILPLFNHLSLLREAELHRWCLTRGLSHFFASPALENEMSSGLCSPAGLVLGSAAWVFLAI
ncbi:uncharacterized protein LOC109363788 [Meleagris gallopavo]|uniref:uncharacterized protein LOC109363788 n=1 Tax=Meleagris gallopavo TaxID=9103 RepID=UPI000940217F|nr:uncharacterized protein LOC109363788 [Meleagris gallopavo]